MGVRLERASLLGLVLVFAASGLLAESIRNWPAPATWTPTRASGLHTMGDITNAMPFIGVTPCRVADTRGNGFGGAYGPPSLVANANRDFVIVGQCGIPTAAKAVSFNFAALNVFGAGDLRVFPAGGGLPLVSTLNYNASTPNIANAAVVPLGTGGAITVRADAVAVDLIIDVNGYYADTNSAILLNPGVYFQIAGNVAPPYATLNARNNSTIAGSTAILGIEGGSTGVTYAITGSNSSTANYAAGVQGNDGAGVANPTNGPTLSAGVVGHGMNGVIGRSSTPGGFAVSGELQNNLGAELALGVVGYSISGTNYGLYAWNGTIGCNGCTKQFVDPHPSDPGKSIHYVSLEGPEAGTYFRGTAETVDREFVIDVPPDFRMVTDPEGLTVQLTPVGAPAVMYVVSEDLDQIVVRSSRDVKFHYLVQGVRPAYKDFTPIQDGTTYLPQTPEGRMPAGWPDYIKNRLIANGTYNPDGTVNMQTAERLGWAQMWRQQEEDARAVAVRAAAARETDFAKGAER